MRISVRQWILVLEVVLLQACGSGTPEPKPAGEVQPAAATSTDTPVSTKPAREKILAHLRDHVDYPVTRTALLAACADTNEFSAAERKWFEDNVPERTYSSPDEVMTALGI